MTTRFRQVMTVDSRSAAAEWGDGLLDAIGGAKRLSRHGADEQAELNGRPRLSLTIGMGK